MKFRCPQCNTRSRMTKDHILPRRMGGHDLIHGTVRNIRPMCQECNEITDQCGQCIGALACVRAVGPVRQIARAWRMSYVAETVRGIAA